MKDRTGLFYCLVAIDDCDGTISPSRFSVCGQISISRLPEGMKQQGRYKVTLSHRGQVKTFSRVIESDPQGSFCFQAKPGDYSVQVRLKSSAVSF